MPVEEDPDEEEDDLEEERGGEDFPEEEEKIDPRTLITQDQLIQLQSLFSHYDIEKKDRLPVKMLGYIIRMMGLNPTKQEIKNLMKEADPNNKGYMDFGMFIVPMVRKINDQPETHEDIIAAFKIFDVEGNGFVYNDFLTENLSSLGEDMDDVELELFFKFADPKQTGRINYVEFVEKIMGVTRKMSRKDRKKGKGKKKKKKGGGDEEEED